MACGTSFGPEGRFSAVPMGLKTKSLQSVASGFTFNLCHFSHFSPNAVSNNGYIVKLNWVHLPIQGLQLQMRACRKATPSLLELSILATFAQSNVEVMIESFIGFIND